MATLRAFPVGGGRPLRGQVTVSGGELQPGGDPVMLRFVQQVIAQGATPDEAVSQLDGWTNGYVIYSTSAANPVVFGGQARRFDVNELRDPSGKWTRGGMAGLPSVRKLAPRVKPITAAEARGNSRAVSLSEFQTIAQAGRGKLAGLARRRDGVEGLDRNWPTLKAAAFAEVRKPWGGMTIDAATGKPLASDADRYALSVKPPGIHTISVPEDASQADFGAAMDRARVEFRGELDKAQHYLGIFHDDDNNRVDIDPVVVVDSVPEVEQIGAYTHAIGGAYHFKSGDGFFAPHVAEGASRMTADLPDLGEGVHWAGPGQWRSAADAAQEPFDGDDGTADGSAVGSNPDVPGDAGDNPVSRGLDWEPLEYLLRAYDPGERRGPDGKWIHGASPVAGLIGTSHLPQSPAQGEPSTAQLMNMISDLRAQISVNDTRLRSEQASKLRDVVEQMRAEEHRIAAEKIAGKTAEELKAERRKAIIRTVATVLGLVAVGVLIVATAGMAVPPLAEAGVAVGPLIGGELISAIGEHRARKKAAESIGRADMASVRDQVVEAMTTLVAKVCGVGADVAARAAESLVSAAEGQVQSA
jgi:hypothetical protein